ncbi:MAG: class B sortase [Mollicutes bacterium]|nr:class B sortase [Mollicutes bacterium]
MKILVKIKDNTLQFYNRKRLNTDYKNMLNTNIISNDELVFSELYIKENYKLLSSFFSELTKTNNLDTIIFQNIDVANLILPFLPNLKNITSINFTSDETLSYKICEKLKKCYSLKYISAHYIPPYLFELLDKYDIIPESRNEILFTSSFMSINQLSTYSSLYYKTSIIVNFPLKEEDKEDFNTFLEINKYLRTIHISNANTINLQEIISLINTYKKRYLKIYLHGDTYSADIINYLQKNNKLIKKKYKISIKLKYSKHFIEKNAIKQTNNSILRSISILIIFTILLSGVFVLYNNYKSMMNVTKIQEEINDYVIAKTNSIYKDNIVVENTDQSVNTYIYSLKDINPDIIGWLKVNNTNIDYPVVKTDNNTYYLNHDLNNKKEYNGWIFMDYQNNEEQLSDNTVIYGHNRYTNGIMFGTLNKILYEKWYSNPENLIISLDTLYNSYQFKIFSAYTILTTNDYLILDYDDAKNRISDFKRFKKRSVHDFNVDIQKDDKILTLSTCNSKTTRLVVHAVLIK